MLGPSSNVKYIIPVVAFSLTITFLSSVAVFPFESVTVYFTIYVPSFDVSTSPEILMSFDTSPSLLSVAVAPCSVYLFPVIILTTDAPFNFITGAVVSIILTYLTVSALFPDESVTV